MQLRGTISHPAVLRCGISKRPMSAGGQQQALPRRTIGVRFSSVSRHKQRQFWAVRLTVPGQSVIRARATLWKPHGRDAASGP